MNEEEIKTPQEEPKPVRPLRQRAIDRNPDFNSDNEEDWAAKEDEVFNEMDAENQSFKDAEDKLSELVSVDDELASVLNDMIVNKTPFRVAIAKFYSQEDLIPEEGDEDYEAYNDAYNEKLDRRNKRNELEKRIADNEQATMNNIDEYASGKGMDDTQKGELIDYINDLFSNMLEKNISPEMLQAFDNARNHDSDVASAEETGEIRGRNARIVADMEEENNAEAGDGIPVLDKGGSPEEESPKNKDMLDEVIGRRKKF